MSDPATTDSTRPVIADTRRDTIGPDGARQRVRLAVGLLYHVDAADDELVMEVDESTDLAAWLPFSELDGLRIVPLVRWARELVGR